MSALKTEEKKGELLIRNRWVFGKWFGVHLLLVFSLGMFLWSTFHRVSQYNYLQGFAEAVVPLGGGDEEVVTALYDWFRNPPRRLDHSAVSQTQDVKVMLETKELLRICGSASYAFHRLCGAVGIPSRPLLLLDERGLTRHIVVEVRVGGRWIVVDPSLRILFRDPESGKLLGKEQLRNPRIFQRVVQKLPNYPKESSYERTAYLRLSRVPVIGRRGEQVLNRWFPGWQERIGRPEILDDVFLRMQGMGLLLVCLSLLLRRKLRNQVLQLKEDFLPLSLRWSLLYAVFALLGLYHPAGRGKGFFGK